MPTFILQIEWLRLSLGRFFAIKERLGFYSVEELKDAWQTMPSFLNLT